MKIHREFAKKDLFFTLMCILLLALSSFFSAAIATPESILMNSAERYSFTKPSIMVHDEMTSITLENATTWTMIPGNPKIPVVSKQLMFPPGTIIREVHAEPTNIHTMKVPCIVEHVPVFRSISEDKTLGRISLNKEVYQNPNPYPGKWVDYTVGAGLNKPGDHVLILSVKLYPVQYHPHQQKITYTQEINVSVSFEQKSCFIESVPDEHKTDLVIITPEMYIDDIGFFVENKTKHGLTVEVASTESIYSQYWGRDHQEQIKRYIFDMVKLKGISFVLILGDMKTVPIRNTDAYPWDDPKPFHGKGLLSDLYYADIFDESFEFCSWDANNNGIYGEVDYDAMHQFPPTAGNIDDVDLYADVHIGRIPFTTSEELITVLKKICHYEDIASFQLWFNKIILIGGDTFPLSKGSPFNQFEGEITNEKVGQQLPGFEKVFLWSSQRNLNAFTFNRAISEGAGFVSYAGHGFEHGWGTYRPNAVVDKNLIIYYTPFLKGITNEDKTPIIFFDACLTAKLDFNISDLISYYGDKARFVNRFLQLDPLDFLPSFAWAFLKKEPGGAVATIGATRPAYTWVDRDGVYAGAGFLDVRFFHAYEDGVTVGEMLTQAQHDYVSYVMKDFFTIEEFLLLGDPSMRVGGYP